MTTKKQMERLAKMNRPQDKEPKLTVPGALGLAVEQALVILGVKTLGLPHYVMSYKKALKVVDGARIEITLVDQPELFKITVELGK